MDQQSSRTASIFPASYRQPREHASNHKEVFRSALWPLSCCQQPPATSLQPVLQYSLFAHNQMHQLAGALLCGVCLFSMCLSGISPSSSHGPKTCTVDEQLILNWPQTCPEFHSKNNVKTQYAPEADYLIRIICTYSNLSATFHTQMEGRLLLPDRYYLKPQ